MDFRSGDRVRIGSGRETWFVHAVAGGLADLRSANSGTRRIFATDRLVHFPITKAEQATQRDRMPGVEFPEPREGASPWVGATGALDREGLKTVLRALEVYSDARVSAVGREAIELVRRALGLPL